MNIIDKVKVSGTIYTLSATSSGGTNAVEITQDDYDALVSGGTVDPTVFYIITDAQGGDLSNYWTSAQTNSAITAAVSGKQDTLVSGTNIKTINNTSILGSGNIDIQGGGKAIEAGRGISITSGETADTVSFSLPISAGTGSNSIICGSNNNKASGSYSFAGGEASSATSFWSFAYGASCNSGYGAWAGGYQSQANGSYGFAIGERTKTSNDSECSIGHYNVTNAGSTNDLKTLFSVGNGTADNARHNAFEIRQNGDIYLSLNGQDVKLQDQLGGSSITVDTALDGSSTNPVENRVIYNKIDEVEQVTAAALNELNETLSGKADSNSVYTKTEANDLLDEKLDVSAYTPTDLSNYYTKSETSGATQISTALASKQTTLTAGTGINITDNVISATGGGGGGKAIEAGRGISITTGATADTVSFNLPISAGTGTNSIVEGHTSNKASGSYSHAEGKDTVASGSWGSHAEGASTRASGNYSHAEGSNTKAKDNYSHAEGFYTIANNQSEHASGQYNVSNKANTTFGDSGNTLFSVGNGTADNARHNAFEIRQNGDIYLSLNGQDVKLQDQLGGSSITVDTALDGSSTNPVENRVIYNKIDEVEQVTAAGLNALNDAFGGLKLVKLTQAEYNALATKDSSTLYVIVG